MNRKSNWFIWMRAIIIITFNTFVTWVTYAPFLPLITDWIVIIFFLTCPLYPIKRILQVDLKNKPTVLGYFATILSLISITSLIPALEYAHHSFFGPKHTFEWMLSCAILFFIGQLPCLALLKNRKANFIFISGCLCFACYHIVFNSFSKTETNQGNHIVTTHNDYFTHHKSNSSLAEIEPATDTEQYTMNYFDLSKKNKLHIIFTIKKHRHYRS